MTPFDLSKPVAIGSDHAGYDLKEELISFLEAKDLAYHDYGTHSKVKRHLGSFFAAVPMELR